MASVRAIAEEAGVSIATVSRVLNNHPAVSEKLRQRVKSVAERKSQANGAAHAAPQTLGVLYTSKVSISSPFDGALLQGFMSEAGGSDAVDMRIMSAAQLAEDGVSVVESLRRRNIGGVLVRTTIETRDLVEQLCAAAFPHVLICDRYDHPNASYIIGRTRSGSREATEHLLAMGHEKIAMVNSLIEDSDHNERLAGYQEALEAAGLDFDPQRVISVWPHRRGGETAMNRIVNERDRPTAIFFTDMGAAMGAAKRAYELGVNIPGDLSIVGVDDVDLRFFTCPTMTAVCQDTVQIGRSAYQMLQTLIRSPETGPLRTEIPSWLEVHQSTAPPAAA